MSQSAIAPDVHQALDIHGDFPAQIAFDPHLLVDDLADAIDLIVGQIAHSRIRADIRPLEKLLARMQPNTEDIGQRRFDSLISREIDSRNSRHVLSPLRPRKTGLLALPLLVPWIDANHPHHTLAPDDLALLATASYRSSYLHLRNQSFFDIGTLSAPETDANEFDCARG
jgi:hypothetical protein